MAKKKTDSSNSPRSDDPVHPTKGGLSAKPITASYPAGAEPGLDTRFHRTSRDSDLIRRKVGLTRAGMYAELLKVLRRPTQGDQPCTSQESTLTQRIQ